MTNLSRNPAGDAPLINLGRNQCRFPVGYDPETTGGHRFCAAHITSDRVYCDHHYEIATAVEPRRARPGGGYPIRRAA